MKYVFMTDVSCDLTQKQVDEVGVAVIPMEFQIAALSATLSNISRRARTCSTRAFPRVLAAPSTPA